LVLRALETAEFLNAAQAKTLVKELVRAAAAAKENR
jgi:hypothetical protein